MPSDYRLKYINSIIGDNDASNASNTSGLISVAKTPDEYVYINSNNPVNYEGFEGGIHINNARTVFLLFAAIIIILYVLADIT